MKIALLHDAAAEGGRPDEQDGLVQVEHFANVLEAQGHQTLRIGFGLDLSAAAQALQSAGVDLAVNFVESVAGHGRLIHLAPSLLEALRIPFTGAGSDAMLLGSHKVWTKRLLRDDGLPTPAWLDAAGRLEGPARFPGRYIVKSVWEDASLGLDDDSVVEVDDVAELRALVLDRGPALGGEAFAETWIEGREFNLSVLETETGPVVLPVAELLFENFPPDKPRLVGYRAKWDSESFEYRATPRSFEFGPADRGLLATLEEMALASWDCVGLRGYARVDFRVDAEGRPWILEVNPNPCLSPDAGFAAAAARAQIGPEDLAAAMIDSALRRREGAGSPVTR